MFLALVPLAIKFISFGYFFSVAFSFTSLPLSFVLGSVLLEVNSVPVLLAIGELTLVVVTVIVECMHFSFGSVVGKVS